MTAFHDALSALINLHKLCPDHIVFQQVTHMVNQEINHINYRTQDEIRNKKFEYLKPLVDKDCRKKYKIETIKAIKNKYDLYPRHAEELCELWFPQFLPKK